MDTSPPLPTASPAASPSPAPASGRGVLRDARLIGVAVALSVAVNALVGGGILYASHAPSASSDAPAHSDAPEITPPQEPLQSVQIDLIAPPKRGDEAPKPTTLPRIDNRPPDADPNRVNPDAKPSLAAPPAAPKPPDRRAPQLPQLPNFAHDPLRPPSIAPPTGALDGSVTSDRLTGLGDPYLQHVKAQLDNNMTVPASIPSSARKNLRARVRVLINDTGYLLKWEWQPGGASDNAAFDLMIADTFKGFGIGGQRKFKQPPPEHLNKWIKVTVDGGQLR